MYGGERVIGRLAQIQSESDRERLTRRLYKVRKILSDEKIIDGFVKIALWVEIFLVLSATRPARG
jgi:hypothetical protein